ncbi:hypothetical protein LZ009_16500 [Ramlibacter sp. XY19]|uniref:hypothetical protein n=1 Tax=Ramlibacter paludis TaxID=2908000 RepID=UPI0023D9A275|nr:hypothetical protein [Ramlibacter paludis]MCG2594378.1 hypothetical protein [Ramlibacter paludis]
MQPRRRPLPADSLDSPVPRWKAAPPPAGRTRKGMAMVLHLSCLALFGLTVVLPVASPLARGELAREFKPVFEALAASPWLRQLQERSARRRPAP